MFVAVYCYVFKVCVSIDTLFCHGLNTFDMDLNTFYTMFDIIRMDFNTFDIAFNIVGIEFNTFGIY